VTVASLRRKRRQSCAKKVRHETFEAATIAAQKTGSGKEVRPYRCGHCGGYHVGHPRIRTSRSDFRFLRATA
jgi:hypothetical protein